MKRERDEEDEEAGAVLPQIKSFESRQEYEVFLEEVAFFLLHRFVLVANGVRYRILEVEMYVHDDNCVWKDMFAHNDSLQRQNASFYFHRSGVSFRGGTYKGLDVTFGAPHCAAAALIRTTQRLDGEKKIFCGPCVVVDELLRSLQVSSIAQYVNEHGVESSKKKKNNLHLALSGEDEGGHDEVKKVYKTPRVGLSLLKHPHFSEDVFFFYAHRLRFLVEPHKVTKHRHLLALVMMEDEIHEDTIEKIVGTKKKNILQWRADYESGQRMCKVESYFGTKVDQVQAYCKMYGAFVTHKKKK